MNKTRKAKQKSAVVTHTSPRPNNPNANYEMYEADRIAKAKAQPKLPSVVAK